VRGHSNPVAWLYRVGINRCKDYRRYLARASRLLTRVAADLPPEAESVEWDNRLDALAVLKRLPVRQRTAAALFFEADLSVADIASTMGISEGAVKSHLSRARESLRQVLEVER
jgi:RNA polymerase sigma factor (sigma-70 family)